MATRVRPAAESDLDAIRSLFEHYVLNTVTSFLIKPAPPDYIKSRFNAAHSRQLPYLIAEQSDVVIGYAYASSFRGFMLGYGHTVEMSIFCHPDHFGKGVGSSLMQGLLHELRNTKHLSWEDGREDEAQEFEIKQIVAVMSIDEQGPGRGLALRDWYVRKGFEEVGHLKKVGHKDGRWIDTLYMQREL